MRKQQYLQNETKQKRRDEWRIGQYHRTTIRIKKRQRIETIRFDNSMDDINRKIGSKLEM